jgi:FtsH-binding integral membrane protein
MMNSYASVSDINSRMISVYNNMFLAVVTSMLVSLAVASSPALMAVLFGTALKWLVIFAPLVMIFAMTWIMERATQGQARAMLHVFAALMGLSMSTIFVVYTTTSIVTAFMGAAILFGTMSMYGYFTKNSLESWGSFLLVGLIAVVITSIVNLFIGSSTLAMVVSAVAIIVFLGLTAYDTQRIRTELSVYEPDSKAEVLGALSLYLNFINIFMSLLQLFGAKNDD